MRATGKQLLVFWILVSLGRISGNLLGVNSYTGEEIVNFMVDIGGSLLLLSWTYPNGK